MPKGKLTLESPEKLDTFEDSLFTCYAFTNVMPLPSDLKLKLTSHQTDHLAELSSSDAVELQSGKIFTTKLSHQVGREKNYRTRAIITRGLYIFYPIFQCGL